MKRLAKYGILGIPFLEEYGGAGGDSLAYVIAVQEISKVSATTGVVFSYHVSLCTTAIYIFGNEIQNGRDQIGGESYIRD